MMGMRTAALLLAIASLVACAAHDAETRVSAPGLYEGWAPELYDEWVRTAGYVPVRDGVRLAVTLYRPAKDGVAVETPHPVVLQFTPYRSRYVAADGEVVASVEGGRDDLRPTVELTRYGYVVAVADIRGKGASFGARRGFQDRTEARDAYDLIEWLASQPWSSGAVGMSGCSYLGGTQLQAATVAPPSLRAVFTGGSDYDKFNFVRRGGVLAQFNTRPDEPLSDDLASVPMDEDPEGILLAEAVAQHADNTPMAALWRDMPYRDSVSSYVGTRFWEEVGVYRYEDVIEESGVAIYHWHNLGDEGRGEGLIAAANLDNPGFVLLGPGGHCEPPPGFDLFAEHLRFFDRYLKGVPNGIDEQPRYRYWTLGAPEGEEWSSADHWPPRDARTVSLHLRDEGVLDAERQARPATTSSAVDYNVACPGDSYFFFGPCVIDDAGVTFTTAPLPEDTHVLGNPNAFVWISSSTSSANLFVYLELVAPDGAVSILSHGRLAAAYRKVSEAPYDTLGQPWHSGLEADQETLAPGQVVEMAIPLLPASAIAPAGSRLRLTVTGADPRQRDLAEIRVDPPPTIAIHSGPAHPSRVELPIVEGR